jgi:hypothetical protein
LTVLSLPSAPPVLLLLLLCCCQDVWWGKYSPNYDMDDRWAA